MHFFYLLAAFLLVRRLQTLIRASPLMAKWNSLFNIATWIIVLIYFAGIPLNDRVKEFLGLSILAGIVFYLDKDPDFKSSRPFLKTHTPLIIAGALNLVFEVMASSLYEQWEEYFQFAIVGAFIWIFARLANSKKQLEELKVVSEQKSELEILVAERTAELTRQRNELQETLKELQTTQSQLIQSEKLASLGELTAGIAHEIQNPLNFVNNFSDVSIELIDEMEEELANGDKEEALAIATDIKTNLEKIRHHGRRADGIVKGMLQHSRASSGQKEPTNINSLADEYFRLAYHGLRAKDKTFNAELITHFDTTLPLIELVPQDIGRVLLNLFTNAFYAVHQKKKTAGIDYKPQVIVSTMLENEFVIVKVWDNGTGIPDAVKDKILQPFFTTKPTGEGTGLGLSLSYDIVVKAHSGSIDINSKEGQFSEFIISLPC